MELEPHATTLRQRGGGAVPQHDAVPLVLKSDTDLSGSCVPAGSEWITKVVPPPRLNKRKSGTVDRRDPTSSRARAPYRRATLRKNEAPSQETIAFGVSTLPPIGKLPSLPSSESTAEWPTADGEGSVAALGEAIESMDELNATPGSLFSAFSTMGLNIDDAVADVTDSLEAATHDDATFDLMLQSLDEPTPKPACDAPRQDKKRVRHNATERNRVDRLNQLFQNLSSALDDPEAEDKAEDKEDKDEEVCKMEDDDSATTAKGGAASKRRGKGAKAAANEAKIGDDAPEIEPPPACSAACEAAKAVAKKKERSKAEVLQTAHDVIHDLRKQLNEEKAAHSLTQSRLATALAALGPSAAAAAGLGDSYENVAW